MSLYKSTVIEPNNSFYTFGLVRGRILITSHRFGDYIEYLRENLINLVEYRERTGTLEPNVLQVKEDMFDDDPFVVFTACIAATVILSDKKLYH